MKKLLYLSIAILHCVSGGLPPPIISTPPPMEEMPKSGERCPQCVRERCPQCVRGQCPQCVKDNPKLAGACCYASWVCCLTVVRKKDFEPKDVLYPVVWSWEIFKQWISWHGD